MVSLPTMPLHAFAAAMILAAAGSSSFASALASYSVGDCGDFQDLPTTLTEDVAVVLEQESIVCAETTTVMVNGPFTYKVVSDNLNIELVNVRFKIVGGAEFTLHLGQDETTEGTATFTGVSGQDSDGGVFDVGAGSYATFGNLMVFDGNTVAPGNSGGAVYVDGEVTFAYGVDFLNNQALSNEDYDAGNGGALAVGVEGYVIFQGVTTFTRNTANSGGRGGAMSNLGEAVFNKRTSFYTNTAKENGNQTGGLGGALYSGVRATTTLRAKSKMIGNTAGNGGAIYNRSGTVSLQKVVFRHNKALGDDTADGGHVHTAGDVSISDHATFKKGFALARGGAAYIVDGGDLVLPSDVTYSDNSALEECDDVYAEGEDPVCQP